MSDSSETSKKFKFNHFFNQTKSGLLIWLIVIILLCGGLGVRLYDLTDPPLDFHPTRQLRGAIIARGIYYNILPDVDPQKRDMAATFAGLTGQYEPPILETLVAYTYRVIGKELFWIARIYSSLFWCIGGLFLFLLGKRMTNAGGGLIALGYYLFLPFASQASRSFQPDPGMVMWIILFAYAIYRWSEDHSWRWALTSGILGGIAILSKPVAVYLVGLTSVVMVLYSLGLIKGLRRIQTWVMAFLMAIPSVIYYLGLSTGNAADYVANWTVALSHLIISPDFYVRWLSFVQNWMGFSPMVLALVGIVVAAPRNKAVLCGLWIGYFIYGLTLPYQMYTHNYYSLQLVPIIALSFTTLGQKLAEMIDKQSISWKLVTAVVALIAIVYPSWVAIATQKAEDYHSEPTYWEEVGSIIPADSKVLALTQDYGYRLMYYGWKKVDLYPPTSEQNLAELRGREKDFLESFNKRIEGKDYFLVTAMGQYNKQTTLKDALNGNYPLIAQGDGYLLFDLRNPKTP